MVTSAAPSHLQLHGRRIEPQPHGPPPHGSIENAAAMKDTRQIAGLRSQLKRKERQLKELVATNQRLQVRQRLLHALCGVVRQMQQRAAGQDAQQQQAWSEQEQELLQQLEPDAGEGAMGASTPSPAEAAAATAAAAAAATAAAAAAASDAGEGVDAPIAPAHDPLMLFRHVMCAPPLARIPTAAAIVQQYRHTMREMSLALHMHDATAAVAAADPQQQQQHMHWVRRLQHVLLQHFRLLGALAQQHRSDLVSVLAATNAETSEVAPELDTRLHRHAVQQAGISDAQMAAVAAGMEALAPLHTHALEQLQAEVGSDGTPAASQEQEEEGQQGSGEQEQELLEQLRRRLPAHQRRLDRIAVCMRKELLVRAAISAFIYGALSWRQLARIHLHTYPYAPKILILGKLIWEQAAVQ